MLTYTSVVRASVEGLAGTFIGRSFFGVAAFLFGLDSLCLFRRKPFLVSISGRPLLLFQQAKPKMASFLRSNFGFEFGANVCLFWSLSQVIPDWLVLEATGCEQRELSLLCCGSTSMIRQLSCHSLSNIEVCANASSNISKHQPAGKRLKSTLAASTLACYVFICTNLEQTRNTRPISQFTLAGTLQVAKLWHAGFSYVQTSSKTNMQGRPPPCPKSLLISGTKNEPSGHGEVLLLK